MRLRYIQNSVHGVCDGVCYIRWSISVRTLCNYVVFRLLIHSNLSTFRTEYIKKKRESFVYSWHRTLCSLRIFTTPVYSSHSIYDNQGIFRTLSNIYNGEFYSEQCVTLPYLEPWHIQNPRHIQNTLKYLWWNVLLKTICNPDIFRNLVYPELKHI